LFLLRIVDEIYINYVTLYTIIWTINTMLLYICQTLIDITGIN